VTRKLRLLDLALVALLGYLGWQMRREWVWEHARADAFRRSIVKPADVAAPAAMPKVEALNGATYSKVAEQNLFSRDRNPTVIIDVQPPPPEPPVPPFPVARGVMLWQGAPPTVVLSETAGGAQKGYHPGDKIGPWTILSVDNRYVVFGWNSKEFKKKIDDLLDRTPILVAEAPAANQNQPQAAAKSLNQGNAASGPGIDIGDNKRGCTPGDKSTPGTIDNGYKKVVVATPFGNSCYWEQAK